MKDQTIHFRVTFVLHLVVAIALVLISASSVLAQAQTVTATWDSNSETNISGYVLSYGASSRSYTTSIDVGNVTSRQLTLNPGRYYFAVQARNTNNQTSPYSTEVVFDVGVVSPPVPSLTSLSPTSGSTGTSVTITGSNFGATQGTSTVRFNGATATVSSWSASSIVATVPSGATSGSVVVTVGGAASNGVSFSVTAPAALPAPWTSRNIGSPALSGTASYASGTFTISGGGTDIWDANDQFNFVYQPLNGNGEIIARVGGIGNTDVWAKAGVMIREDLTGGARHVMSLVSAASGFEFQRRLTPGAIATGDYDIPGAPPQWIRLVRSGNTFTGYYSSTGSGWTSMGTVDVAMAAQVYIGLAVTSHNPGALTTATINNVTVTSGSPTPPAPTITSLSPTSGPVGTSVTISGANFGSTQGTSTIRFNGTTATPTSWGASSIVAPVPSGATTGSVVVTVNGVASNGSTYTVTTPAPPAPAITSLSPTSGPVGTSVTISGANFGSTQGTSTVRFNGTTATPTSWGASSIVASVPTGATSGNVVVTVGGVASGGSNFTVTTPSGLPAPWASQNIGSPALTGTASYGSGTFTISGGGNDIWNANDQFNFVYQPLNGNGEIIARVGSLGNTDAWAKAGVMVREDLTGGARNVMSLVSAESGLEFQRRLSPGATATGDSGMAGAPPQWIRLVRTGNTFAGYYSSTGSSWTSMGTVDVAMAAQVYIGLAVTSHNPGALTTATINNVTVTSGSPTPPAPTITSLSPTSGPVGTSVTISGANFGSTQGTSTVRFNGTTATPTSWGASSIVAPVPSGATTGSVVVTVNGAASNGSTYTVTTSAPPAPAITSLSPTSGPVGTSVTISGANFGSTQGTSTVRFNGTTATPTSWGASSIVAPVPGGATSGNVVVTVGGVASGGSNFTVTTPSGLPAPWTSQNIGSPALAGTASYASGTFTVSGGGDDIWNANDQFNFVYQTLTGDGEIVARVDTLQDTDAYAKAGVMIRQDLSAGAANAMARVTQTAGTMAFQRRLAAGQITTSNSGFTGLPTQWVKLVRSGNTITGYYSANGTSWTLMGSDTFSMPATVYAGVAVTSHNVSLLNTSTISNVTVTSGSPTPPPAAITLTQDRQTDAGTVQSRALAYNSSVTPGSLLAVVARSGQTNQTFTVTDSRGNTYKQAARRSGTDHTVGIYYAENAVGGTNTVTVAQGTSSTLRFVILEFGGVATANALDVAGTSSGSTTSPSASATTTTAGDLLLGGIASSAAGTFTAGSGYSIAEAVPAAPSTRLVAEWKLQSASGNTSAGATLSASTAWAAAIAAFKPASAGGGSLMTLSSADSSSAPLLNASVEKGADSSASAPEAGSEPVRVPVGGDYDGDGRADPATYRPSTGQWRVLTAASNYTSGIIRTWGTASDLRVPGDYDGDGKTDLAYYRPTTGSWSILLSSTGLTQMLDLVIGAGGETPAPADYDGDGATDVAVYDGRTGQWRVLTSGAGFGSEILRNWGSGSDVPVPGDYDGDGKADPAVYSPATGEWKILSSATDYSATVSLKLGNGKDVPVPADFDGDGTTDAAVFRPSSAEWRIVRSDGTTTTVTAGASGTPVALDYDGDGKADLAVFQSGVWHLQLSSVDYAPALSIDAQGNKDVPLTMRP